MAAVYNYLRELQLQLVYRN